MARIRSIKPDYYIGDHRFPTYAWTDSIDPEIVSHVEFLNQGLSKKFWKQRVRKARRFDGRPSPGTWAEIRERIFARDDYTCHYCKKRGGRLECDHVRPVAKGGSHADDNLVTACFLCNRSKRDKTLEEWLRA